MGDTSGSPGWAPEDEGDQARQGRSLGRSAAYGCLAGLVLSFGLHAVYTLLGPNFHTVVPGRVYRCAQPSGRRLEELIRRKNIRTIVNLRGCCEPLPWYVEQCRVTNRLNVSQEDLSFSAARMPSVLGLRQLVEVLDHSELPLLFHCHKGADRSGLASAIALLLLTDTPLEDARHQLGPRYGHLPLGRTVYLDRFFDLYREWLAAQGRSHSPDAFRQWAEHDYCPAECRCTLELLDNVQGTLHVPPGRPWPVRVRCHNTSIKPWHLRPGNNTGIHLVFLLLDTQDQQVADGRAGLFNAVVPPGEHIDLTVALPALPLPGHFLPARYLLRLDMVDEQHAGFLQEGSQPLELEVEVP
jgi:hypothetical protein